MALHKRGKYWYGDAQDDLHPELLRYSKVNGYVVDHYADAVCTCGGQRFWVGFDEVQGAAVRVCTACEKEHPIGDSADYLDEAELQGAECVCGAHAFEITVGVSLYRESEDVRWLYLGLRCVQCGLLGCYADWKNEYIDYRALLANV
jgi:hypothetical protein